MNLLTAARAGLSRLPRPLRLLVVSPVQVALGTFAFGALVLVSLLCLAYLISPVIAWRNQRRLEDSCPPGEPRLAEFWRQTSRPEPNAAARRFEELSVEAGIDVAPKDTPGRPHLDSRRVKEVAADREVLRTYWDERRLRADDEWMEPPLSLRSRIGTPAFQAGREFLLGTGPLLWEFDHEKGEARPFVDLLGLLTWTRLLGLDALESARRGDYQRAAGSLEAAWRLRDAMAERPQMISAAIALAVEQEIESVLRLLDAPPAVWVERLRACDHEARVARALRGEVLFWVGLGHHGWRHLEPDGPLRFPLFLDPLVRAGAPRIAADLEEAVATSTALKLPEATPERLTAIWDRRFGFLDVLGRSAWPDLSDFAYRRLRVTLQHELTVLAIRIRRGEAVGSHVASLAYPGESWLVTEGEIRFSRSLRERDSTLFRPPLHLVLRRRPS
ncbi:MAG: hypothetical protein IT186_01445 [Acidobacteria bacterium]|nr:hypothetical protein [Acidobacteriota bacterium]MCG3195343.1 hypothetical protein [Thermoanaerobaculia bacterium]